MSDDHDQSPWAPADGEPVSAPRPPDPPLEESPLARNTEQAAVAPPESPPPLLDAPTSLPSAPPEESPPSVESVSVGPVVAEAAVGSRWVAKSVALIAALVLIGGGGFLAFNAGSATGGADTPAEALESMLMALSSGDLLAASELIEPSERDTLIAAGFDLADELVRLEVLADDLDLSSLRGIDLAFDELDVREEFPRSGLAHLFVERAVVSGSIDGGRLPWGSVQVDRLPDGWLASGESEARELGPSSAPIVAVERDGRWYLSLWYSVAENARIDADQPLPDLGRRPAQIGAASPDEAISRFSEELLRLDVRRMIGMLDPEEARAIYDYSPLFLDGATRAANEILVGLEESGWSWEVELLDVSTTVTDGDVATTDVGGFDLEARGETGSLDIEVRGGAMQVTFSDVDFWGDPYRIDIESDAGCFTTTRQDASGIDSNGACFGELADTGLSDGLVALFENFTTVSVVTHRVDDRWFISPTRTGAETFSRLVRSLSTDDLVTVVDGMLDLGDGLDGPLLSGVDPFSPTSVFGDDAPAAPGPSAAYAALTNGDLLGEVELTFAFDLDQESAAAEVALWAPIIDDVPVERGVGATVRSPSGDFALTVLVTPTADDATGVGQFLAVHEDVVPLDVGPNLTFIYLIGDGEDPVVVAVKDDRVVIVASLGAAVQDLLEVAKSHVG